MSFSSIDSSNKLPEKNIPEKRKTEEKKQKTEPNDFFSETRLKKLKTEDLSELPHAEKTQFPLYNQEEFDRMINQWDVKWEPTVQITEEQLKKEKSSPSDVIVYESKEVIPTHKVVISIADQVFKLPEPSLAGAGHVKSTYYGKLRAKGAGGEDERVFESAGIQENVKYAISFHHAETVSNLDKRDLSYEIELHDYFSQLVQERKLNPDNLCLAVKVRIVKIGEEPVEEQGLLARFRNGGDLEKTRLKLSKADKMQIAIQIGQALTDLHQVGYAHRDVRLANVFLERNGKNFARASLGDFGLCTAIHKGQKRNQASVFPSGYYPEESLFKEHDVDSKHTSKVDDFQFGIFLYQLFSTSKKKDKPFYPTDLAAIPKARGSCETWPGFNKLPEEVKKMIGTLTAADTDKRMTVEEALTELQRMQGL